MVVQVLITYSSIDLNFTEISNTNLSHNLIKSVKSKKFVSHFSNKINIYFMGK